MENKCALCGAELPMDRTQLIFATNNKGVESACLKHEFSAELENYIKENGGKMSINVALNKQLRIGGAE